MFAGLVGAIAWNLATWYFGLPSSSSHALIGGIVGAVLVADGPDAVFFEEGILGKVMIPAVVAPLLAFAVGGLSILLLYRITGRQRPRVAARGFRLGQVLSGGMLALAHGTNDAQKTMGVIALALVAHGDPQRLGSDAADLGGGLRGGGDRARHLRRRLADHQHHGQPHPQDGSAQGFAAQGAGAAVILAATHAGFPLSTTHTISGAVIGLGRRQAALGGALGGGRQHRHRLGADLARRRRRSARSSTASPGCSAPGRPARWWSPS